MKKIHLAVLFFFVSSICIAQKKVHSHNDYAQEKPFVTAYANKADEIEADIFLVGDSLVVSHTKKTIDPTHTLAKLYLDPIAALFKQNNGKVSADKNYTFSLMIDVKENWDQIYPVLKKEIERYGKVFDRSRSKSAIQIVISGDRPVETTFHTYPSWLFFDGLPTINYAKEDLERVTMISDNFATYSKWKGVGKIPSADAAKLKEIILAAHQLKKPVRFWGAPDTEDCWREQLLLGADILNTDLIEKSTHYLTDFKP